MKYSNRGSTIDVYIEITVGKTQVDTEIDSSIQSYVEGNESHKNSKQDSARKLVSSVKHKLSDSPQSGGKKKLEHGPGSFKMQVYSGANACSKEMHTLFGVSNGGISVSNSYHRNSTRLLLDDSLSECAMLVVRVVDGGIGLSGRVIVLPSTYQPHFIDYDPF